MMNCKTRMLCSAAAMLLASCSSGESADAQRADVPRVAAAAAKAQILDTVFKQCGEWWGGKRDPTPEHNGADFQLKNVRVAVERSDIPLTETEKFNGIEWQGIVYLYADASREREYGADAWTPWKNGLPHNVAGTVTILKVHGEWQVVHPEKLGSTAACPD